MASSTSGCMDSAWRLAWVDFYAEVMEEAGFLKGVGCSVIFMHEEKDLLDAVHGDDFVFGGNDEDLKWVAKVLAAKFVIKVRAVLGPEDEDQRDEVLLGDSSGGGVGELNGRRT